MPPVALELAGWLLVAAGLALVVLVVGERVELGTTVGVAATELTMISMVAGSSASFLSKGRSLADISTVAAVELLLALCTGCWLLETGAAVEVVVGVAVVVLAVVVVVVASVVVLVLLADAGGELVLVGASLDTWPTFAVVVDSGWALLAGGALVGGWVGGLASAATGGLLLRLVRVSVGLTLEGGAGEVGAGVLELGPALVLAGVVLELAGSCVLLEGVAWVELTVGAAAAAARGTLVVGWLELGSGWALVEATALSGLLISSSVFASGTSWRKTLTVTLLASVLASAGGALVGGATVTGVACVVGGAVLVVVLATVVELGAELVT